MWVFRDRMMERGGQSFPLAHYLQHEEQNDVPLPEPHMLLLCGRTFHESLGGDWLFPSVVTFLLGGADVNARDKDGATALHVAVTQGNDIATVCTLGREPFLGECSNEMIIRFLIGNGADINARNASGETPLMVAAAKGNITAMRLLLERGAVITQRDDAGYTVLHHASRSPFSLQLLQCFVDSLLHQVVSEDLLHFVCQKGGKGANFVILFLVEQLGMDVNAREGECVKASTGEELKPEETSVMSAVAVRSSYTPLHRAVLGGDVALVCALLSCGADVNQTDVIGLTALQLAANNAGVSAVGGSWLQRFVNIRSLWCPTAAERRVRSKEVYNLLKAYCKETSLSGREALLQRFACGNSPSQNLLSFKGALVFADGLIVVHALMVLCATLTNEMILIRGAALFSLFVSFRLSSRNFHTTEAKSLYPAGCFVGYTIALAGCCVYQLHYVSRQPTPSGLYCIFTLLCGVGSLLCGAIVARRDPLVVNSTPAQRAAIHKTVFCAKGVLPDETKTTFDTQCMVRKPLRAQRCQYTNRIVLRYDHYCPWLANSIGAGNHRLYVTVLVVHAIFLVSMWLLVGWSSSRISPGGTTLQRLSEAYMMPVLPVVLIGVTIMLLRQLWYISRGVTMYDVQHPSQCLWCFQLGTRTYSLFDAGTVENLRGFFMLREDFAKCEYLVPGISSRLKDIVKKHQEMQLPCGDHCEGHLPTDAANSQHQPSMPSSYVDANLLRFEQLTRSISVNKAAQEADALPSSSVVNAPSVSASGIDDAAMRLFQRMVQSNSADVTVTDIKADITPSEWQTVESRAREMFSFFVESMKGSTVPSA